MENYMEISYNKQTNKLGLKLSYDPGIPLQGISPEETIIEKDTCTQMFIAAILKNSQDMEAS